MEVLELMLLLSLVSGPLPGMASPAKVRILAKAAQGLRARVSGNIMET